MGDRFNSRMGMMLAMLGMAVGTGNIWRFPRIAAKNGGGEFLVAWIVFLFIWSIPIILLEFGMGKLGKISRVAAPFLGAPFTYVYPKDRKRTAEGQFSEEKMKEIINLIS